MKVKKLSEIYNMMPLIKITTKAFKILHIDFIRLSTCKGHVVKLLTWLLMVGKKCAFGYGTIGGNRMI